MQVQLENRAALSGVRQQRLEEQRRSLAPRANERQGSAAVMFGALAGLGLSCCGAPLLGRVS